MALAASAAEAYPSTPPSGDVVERLCGDSDYEQAFEADAGVYVVHGTWRDGVLDGPVVLGFEKAGGHQLEGQFEKGRPGGAWKWDTTADTVGLGRCASQSGDYSDGERQGSWHFEEFYGNGSAKYDLAFVEGAVDGEIHAQLGVGPARGEWRGQAHHDERAGTWTFIGDADLQGTSITEEWSDGKLLRRKVTPGPCAVIPVGSSVQKLCESPDR